MVNLAVRWAGPNFSLSTLAKELNSRFGPPTRPYEYVAGSGPTTWNISGHNADSNGRGHSMDIFVGPGQNISVDQGIDLAERLRVEGTKGTIYGHPDRLAYIIHRGRIAGDHTNWEWVPYYGIADHYDHIHVSSVFDYYWGDPVAGNPLDYNSTLAWNLFVPAENEDDMAQVPQDQWDSAMAILVSLSNNVATKTTIADQAKNTPREVWSYVNPGLGGADAYQILRDALASSDKAATLAAEIASKMAVGGATIEQIEKAVKAALASGVDVNVTVGGSK